MTTGWGMSQRNSIGFDAGLTWQRGDHEIRAGFDYKKYTYRAYQLSTSAMYNLNKALLMVIILEKKLLVVIMQAVTTALSLYNRNGQIGYDDYGNEIDDDWDGPREPTVTSLYVNDKFESGDLVVKCRCSY